MAAVVAPKITFESVIGVCFLMFLFLLIELFVAVAAAAVVILFL